MKYIEAIKEMKKGKKVKRKAHFDDFSYGIVNGIMYEYKNNVRRCTYICHIDSILANDWEVVEEKKTLWDKRKPYLVSAEYGGFDFLEEDVKEALKEFLKFFKMSKSDLIDVIVEFGSVDGDDFIIKKAKEIFGEEMLSED